MSRKVADGFAGGSVLNFLPNMLRSFREVRQCTILELRPPKSMDKRTDLSERLLENAKKAREKATGGASFHEALMDLALRADFVHEILDTVTAHQSLDRAVAKYTLPRDEWFPAKFREIEGLAAPGNLVVLLSRVQTAAGTMHLKLLDFSMEAAEKNHNAAFVIARKLGGGAVVLSGTSYHYYGADLLAEEDFLEWLLRVQLLSSYVDTRWITHQMLERCCALRISTNGRDHRMTPTVLKCI